MATCRPMVGLPNNLFVFAPCSTITMLMSTLLPTLQRLQQHTSTRLSAIWKLTPPTLHEQVATLIKKNSSKIITNNSICDEEPIAHGDSNKIGVVHIKNHPTPSAYTTPPPTLDQANKTREWLQKFVNNLRLKLEAYNSKRVEALKGIEELEGEKTRLEEEWQSLRAVAKCALDATNFS